ncbi:PREDICTED: UDP-glucuronosyltransferase 3A1-like, partial [Priapulus caudatus]|uniref:UDP-glucuronosyltransferase 3A1-like n=1 Tax=Priapulus caudatus TaxID=37621 RepID=A0ABM1EIE0_PRICU
MKSLLLLFGVAVAVAVASAGKVLVKPVGPGERGNSHRLYMDAIADILADDGHAVSMLVAAQHADASVSKYKFITYGADGAAPNTAESQFSVPQTSGGNCELLLSNRTLLDALAADDFDVVVVDGLSFCDLLLVRAVQSPFVVVGTAGFSMVVGNDSPNMLSFVSAGAFTANTDRMSFAQRLNNVVEYLLENLMLAVVEGGFMKIGRDLDVVQRGDTIASIRRRASLVFIASNFALDYPRPLLPNVQLIGGLLARPAGDLQ